MRLAPSLSRAHLLGLCATRRKRPVPSFLTQSRKRERGCVQGFPRPRGRRMSERCVRERDMFDHSRGTPLFSVYSIPIMFSQGRDFFHYKLQSQLLFMTQEKGQKERRGKTDSCSKNSVCDKLGDLVKESVRIPEEAIERLRIIQTPWTDKREREKE